MDSWRFGELRTSNVLKMSPPTVRVNTFVAENEIPQVDPISKIFIFAEVLFGLDRLPLIGRGNYFYISLTFMMFVAISIPAIWKDFLFGLSIVAVAPFVQNAICTLLSYVRCKFMLGYYHQLSLFDAEAGCYPKITVAGIRNVGFAIISCAFTIALFTVPIAVGYVDDLPNTLIPFYIVCVLEVYYFGHLLNLLTPRLKLINYYIESSLSSTTEEPCPVLKEFVYCKSYNPKIAQNSMSKLFDMYQIVVEAYDSLIEGIKWQLLTIIICDFVAILGYLYTFSLTTIRNGGVLNESAIYQLGVPVILLTPLFAPCMSGDSIYRQVRKLRELLASRLYENKLDKSGRSTARALLAFTEARDLSFRLLRMLNIDISLPFKFVGLLVTYLIILLQFEKVINQ